MKESFIFYKYNLQGEYAEVFDKIVLYGEVSGIDNDTMEERMMDLVDMFLTAQKKGKPVSKIVGKDLDIFCKNFFEDYSFTDRIKAWPKRWLWGAWFVFVFELLEIFFAVVDMEENISLWEIQSDMGPYAMGLFVGCVIVALIEMAIRPMVFKIKWLSTNMYEIFIILLVFGIPSVFAFLEIMPQIEISELVVVLIFGTYLVAHYLVRAYVNYKRYGSVYVPKEERSAGMYDSVHERLVYEYPKILTDKYEKQNRKLLSKEKAVLTEEQYMEKLRKQVVRERRISKGSIIGIIVFCSVCAGIEMCISLVDGIILLAILLLVSTPGILLIRKGMKKNALQMCVKECEERGITIMELAKEREAHES